MKPSKTHPQAIMNIDNGEEIAGMWVTPNIPGTGVYKLLAKRRKDDKYEWAHFVQRDNGLKESIYRGEVDSKEQLNLLLDIVNKNLRMAFGQHIQLDKADYDMWVIGGGKSDGTVN